MTVATIPFEMTVTEALAVLRTERTYQLLKWGVRQPDGAFAEMPKSEAEWALLIEHHLEIARTELATCAGIDAALDRLRRVGAIALAAIEVGCTNRPAAATCEGVAAYCADAHEAQGAAETVWILEARFAAGKLAVGAPTPAPLHVLADVVQCFRMCGAPVRVLPTVMYNRRDGQEVRPAEVP